MSLDIAISPCPNDTFIFGYLEKKGFLDQPVELFFHDVEELNQIALEEQRYSVSKNSFYAVLKLQDSYELLNSGGALGRGCGPLFITGPQNEPTDLETLLKKHKRILVPGLMTTAFLLLQLFLADRGIDPGRIEFIPLRYDKIIHQLKTGTEALGLIIHEERFTFAKDGCRSLQDLGFWWEKKTNLPIPLGGICLRKDRMKIKEGLEDAITESIKKARKDTAPIMNFIKNHAQSLEESVIRSHIELYVNDFSLDTGSEGREAIQALKEA
ncbi:MAG: 1,4-dihydroxy-6-naphthoate synthase, partial [Spirochaetia bacterium]|nr:1,4-dihydroxy-6-naphthoate synthase [Spirochaetia bacterium]